MRINGDHGLFRKILPRGENGFVELFRLPARFFERFVIECVRQFEFADDRQRIDARTASRPQHLDDHPFAIVDMRGKADHFQDDLIVDLRALGARVPHKNWLREQGAVD